MKIAIIGAGNLGKAIAEGLIKSKFVAANQITLTRRNTSSLKEFQNQGCTVISDNKAACKNADIIIVAVKPYNVKEIVAQLKPVLTTKQILISVVTGIFLSELQSTIGKKIQLFRAMPNTAISIRQSMTCIAYKEAESAQVKIVEQLFNSLGKSIIIDENLMDAATVLGACGTAYAMRFIRANIQGGIEIGFSAKDARLIAAQTIMGAAKILLDKNTHPEEEIDKVTTPKGCTIAGLNEMEHQGFSSSLIKGIAASFNKITH